MKKTFLKSIILLFFLVLLCSKLNAQGVYITKLSDLEFGEVFIGYDAEVQHTDINAAKFSFYHTQWRSRNVYIQFILPATLDNGTYKIPITFDYSHTGASYYDQTSGRVNFDPRSTVYIASLYYYRTVYLWLGATISTSPTLKYGTYTGTIILNIYY